ncbi:MAG: replication protein RepA [Janthinobacterium lividum]
MNRKSAFAKKLGDVLPRIPKPKSKAKAKAKAKDMVPALSKRQSQLINLAGAVTEQTPEEADELGFMSRLLIMVNLPYRELADDRKVWIRRNGKISIVVAAAYDKDGISLGIPYGAYPRLILAYLVTQAVKTESPIIYLGKSFSQFLTLLNVKKGGKTYKQINKQIKRTLSASFSWIYETNNTQSRTNIQVSHQSNLWWDEKDPDQQSLWENYIKLNTDFFNEIIRHAVPLDLRVLGILKNSPLGLDLYMFISWRVYKIDKPVFISWASLQQQLGGQYADLKEFSRKCRMHINHIQTLRPDLNINFVKGRLCLKPT